MITFKLNDYTEIPQDMIDSLPCSGACDEAIESLMRHNKIYCDRQDAIRYLESLGFEIDEHDSDHDLTSRVLWIACLDCRENESTGFYMEQ